MALARRRMSFSLSSMNRQRPTADVACALLLALYSLFALQRMRGALSLEAHLEDPRRSSIFHYHGALHRCPWLMGPLTDVLRLVTLGMTDPPSIDATLAGIVEAEERDLALLLRKRGLVLPVVAGAWAVAVTALDWWTSPVLPLSALAVVALLDLILMHRYRRIADHRLGLLRTLRQAMALHARGNAPMVSVEVARQTLPAALRPDYRTFEAAALTASARSLDYRFSVLPAANIPEDGDYERAMRDFLASETEPDRPSAVLPILRDIAREVPPDLAWAYLAFDALSQLDAMSVQTLLRHCDKDLWVKALLGAHPSTAVHFFEQISSRASRLLREDMAGNRSLPASEIVMAQRAVVEQAADLMHRGEIQTVAAVLNQIKEGRAVPQM